MPIFYKRLWLNPKFGLDLSSTLLNSFHKSRPRPGVSHIPHLLHFFLNPIFESRNPHVEGTTSITPLRAICVYSVNASGFSQSRYSCLFYESWRSTIKCSGAALLIVQTFQTDYFGHERLRKIPILLNYSQSCDLILYEEKHFWIKIGI